MKLLLAGATALALLMPVGASADTAKTDTYVIKGGSFACKSCNPSFTVRADGNAWPVKGTSYDAIAVRLTSNGITEYHMKGGKVVMTINISVSPDGRTATTDFTDTSGVKPQKGFIVSRRVASSPKGANPVSGSWQVVESSGAKLAF